MCPIFSLPLAETRFLDFAQVQNSFAQFCTWEKSVLGAGGVADGVHLFT